MSERHRCLSTGTLRALLDEGRTDELETAIGGCADCLAQRDVLTQRRDLIERGLHVAAGVEVDTAAAWQQLQTRLRVAESGAGSQTPAQTYRRKEPSRMAMLMERRPVRYAGAVAAGLAVVLVMVFTPMRTVADDFLNQFRVQKFAAVTIPMDLVAPFSSDMLDGAMNADPAQLEDEFGALGTFDTTFDMDKQMEDMSAVLTPEEAEAAYGAFDTPDDLPAGFDGTADIWVTDAGSASYALNTAEAQAIIDEMGIPIYSLPDAAEYPELTFEVNLPQAVIQSWTDADGEQLLVGQMESPTFSYPDGLNMDNLREDILQFPGLPSDLVAQLRGISDWESTLIIPVPEGAETENVTINGEAGLLIRHDDGSAILWQKDGILYAVAGQVSADDVRDVADSMQ